MDKERPSQPEETDQAVPAPVPKQEEPAAETKRKAESLHAKPSGKRKSKSRPVTVYLTVLFAVAFLLLLVSFFMQQRNHEAIMDITSSVDKAQTITDLELAKQQLEFKLEDSRQALDQAKAENETLTQQLSDQQKATQAVDWLRRIETAYRQGAYSTARRLMTQFQATGLEGNLPTEAVTEDGTVPLEAYRNLKNMLT